MPSRRLLSFASVAALALAGCGDSGNEPRQLPSDARVDFDADVIDLNVGATATGVGARLVNAAGQPINGFALSYAAADAAGPVQVSSNGSLTGVRAGPGRVRVSVGTRVLDSIDVDVLTRPEGVVDASPSVGARPFGVAASRLGAGLVTQLDASSVRVANMATRTLGATIPVGFTPTGISFNPAGTTAYVANQGSSNVGVIDMATSTQVATIPVPGNPFVTAVSRDGQRVYVGTNMDKVYVINAATRSVIGEIATGSVPNSIAVARDGSRIYVANAFSGTVTEVNTATNAIVRDFNVGGTPQGVVVTRDKSRLFVSNEAGRVDVIALPAGTVGTPIQLPGAFDIALSPDQSRLYVTLLGGGVRVIDAGTLTPGATLATEFMARRVAFDHFGQSAIVATEAGTVTFIR